MQFKTPDWWNKKNLIAFILKPFSFLYYLLLCIKAFLNLFKKSKKFSAKIICVGNIVAGGTGKTPFAIALAEIYQKKGEKVAFIKKKYKAKIKGSVKVDHKKHSAMQVGDEALLLNKIADCYLCEDRISGCKMAEENGTTIIILDDGLHDKSIDKDLTFLLVDNEFGFGNNYLLPAGPMRFPIGWHNFDVLVNIGKDEKYIAITKPVITAELKKQEFKFDKKKEYVAFAGIGRPEKFFKSLETLGVKLKEKISYPDHYNYSEKEIDRLKKISEKNTLITTEKDYVKLAAAKIKNLKILKIKIDLKELENSNLI